MRKQTWSSQDLKKVLRVKWFSGSEFIDLTEIRKREPSSENVRLTTSEVRADGRTAFYYPLLNWISKDRFALEYTDPGEFETGESAEGDLGTATYKYSSGAWTCSWAYAGSSLSSVDPECTLLDPEVERELELVRRTKRDRAFRHMILAADENQCAITREKITCLLDAAHVHEVRDNGLETPANGFIVRKDIHALFDAWLIRINSDTGAIEFTEELSSSYQSLFGEFKMVRPTTLVRIRENLLIRNRTRTAS